MIKKLFFFLISIIIFSFYINNNLYAWKTNSNDENSMAVLYHYTPDGDVIYIQYFPREFELSNFDLGKDERPITKSNYINYDSKYHVQNYFQFGIEVLIENEIGIIRKDTLEPFTNCPKNDFLKLTIDHYNEKDELFHSSNLEQDVDVMVSNKDDDGNLIGKVFAVATKEFLQNLDISHSISVDIKGCGWSKKNLFTSINKNFDIINYFKNFEFIPSYLFPNEKIVTELDNSSSKSNDNTNQYSIDENVFKVIDVNNKSLDELKDLFESRMKINDFENAYLILKKLGNQCDQEFDYWNNKLLQKAKANEDHQELLLKVKKISDCWKNKRYDLRSFRDTYYTRSFELSIPQKEKIQVDALIDDLIKQKNEECNESNQKNSFVCQLSNNLKSCKWNKERSKINFCSGQGTTFSYFASKDENITYDFNYEGYCIEKDDDRFHGLGVLTYEDGTQYIDCWDTRKPSFKDIYFNKDLFADSVDIGNGPTDELAEIIWKDGSYYYGAMTYGEANGRGVFIDKKNNFKEGDFCNGKFVASSTSMDVDRWADKPWCPKICRATNIIDRAKGNPGIANAGLDLLNYTFREYNINELEIPNCSCDLGRISHADTGCFVFND